MKLNEEMQNWPEPIFSATISGKNTFMLRIGNDVLLQNGELQIDSIYDELWPGSLISRTMCGEFVLDRGGMVLEKLFRLLLEGEAQQFRFNYGALLTSKGYQRIEYEQSWWTGLFMAVISNKDKVRIHVEFTDSAHLSSGSVFPYTKTLTDLKKYSYNELTSFKMPHTNEEFQNSYDHLKRAIHAQSILVPQLFKQPDFKTGIVFSYGAEIKSNVPSIDVTEQEKK